MDCSVALAGLLPEEAEAAQAAPILEQVAATGTIVPPLRATAVGNGLLAALRRNRIDAAEMEAALILLGGLPIAQDHAVGSRAWTHALSLARWHGLTLYDAVGLDLAKHRGLPLASFDRQLRRSARDEGVAHLPAADA